MILARVIDVLFFLSTIFYENLMTYPNLVRIFLNVRVIKLLIIVSSYLINLAIKFIFCAFLSYLMNIHATLDSLEGRTSKCT
jgi:hypothetical protein